MKTVTEITAEKKEASEIRLAAYCRVSSGSADQRRSFAAQIQYYSDYCKQNPQYRLVDVYADEAVTGTCAEKRDDFLRLMQDCRKGKIDRIILTGGLAHSKYVAAYITKKVSFIAPVEVMAGEFELEAMASGACRVLDGVEEALVYSGEPVFTGFND